CSSGPRATPPATSTATTGTSWRRAPTPPPRPSAPAAGARAASAPSPPPPPRRRHRLCRPVGVAGGGRLLPTLPGGGRPRRRPLTPTGGERRPAARQRPHRGGAPGHERVPGGADRPGPLGAAPDRRLALRHPLHGRAG